VEPGADAYRVDLSIYNGPLDLLLYLIREREMDIHDIPIAEITDPFLAHVEVVRRIDIERAGDFLLMAATLMLIKSRTLVPRPEEEEAADEELDPRTDLVRQLLEYKRFKELSGALGRAESERAARFGSGIASSTSGAADPGKLLDDIGVDDLFLAFERMMRETLSSADHQVAGEVLPLREVENRIVERLGAAGGEVAFRDLFFERRDRFYIVSAFLCLLELLRGGRIELTGGQDAAHLRIRWRSANPAAPGPIR